jgi:hypothetical protein
MKNVENRILKYITVFYSRLLCRPMAARSERRTATSQAGGDKPFTGKDWAGRIFYEHIEDR